jgi:hypothetical protein
MKCTACGCPGAYSLLTGVLCWSRACRNFHQDVVSGSDFSLDGKRINGDPIEELHAFLGDDFEF